MKLDWSKIDNEKTFQNLVNHLFFLECPSSFGFVPFSPYIGKDGGWDGKYQGRYPKENLEGRYCIQAKYTKHNLNAAMPSLRGWVKKELKKARHNQVEHLRLATSADLREEHITELEALNKRDVKTFKVWNGHDLLERIKQEPFLRSYYFSSPAIPLFVPASIYFKDDKNLVSLDESFEREIKSIECKIDELIQFFRNERLKIFVIHAPGGFGKSHLLRKFPLKAMKEGIEREIWFIRDGIRDVRDAFNDEIGVRETAKEKRKYVFVLDDADRADDIKGILACVTKLEIDAKIVFSLRTAGLFALEESLIANGCRDLTVITSILQWSNDELKMLLRTVAQNDEIIDEDEIVRRYPNPFFIVRIGLDIKGQHVYDFESTKQSILQSLLNDTRQILSTEQMDFKELLLHLALITPLNTTDCQTRAKLARKLGIDEQRIMSILEKLSRGGVLHSIGCILRFIPDMIGDIYLLETMQSLSEDTRKQAFLYWLDSHSKNIFCNLGATLRYGDKDCLVPIVTDVVSGWINNAGKYDWYDKRRVLENLKDVCYFIPDKALDMLWAFIDDSDLNTDAFGPTIVRLIHSKCNREEIVKIIEGLRCRAKQGTYDNYKPNTLVEEAVTPLRNDIEKQIMPILAIIKNSLNGANPIIHFAKSTLHEVLAAAHEWRHSTYKSMVFGSRYLKVTEEVLKMRKTAIEITKTMLLDRRSAVRLAAIEIVGNLGKSRLGRDRTDIPLKDWIVEERQEMLGFIEKNNLIAKETDLHILSAYEDLLFRWWAQQVVPDEKSLPLLNQFTYDSEYRIFRYYTSRWDITEDVRSKLREAPSKDRWSWALDNLMERESHLTIEDFKKDAASLNQKYPTVEAIVDYLDELGKAVTVSSANALFLRAWFKENPGAFQQIRLRKNLWDKIPLIFKYTITYDLVQKYPDMARLIINETLLAQEILIDESKIAIDILTYDLPSLDKYGIIKSVAEKNIDDLNLTIIQRFSFVGDKISPKEMAEIVLIVLNHLSPSVRSKSINDIAFILHNKNQSYIKEFLCVTRDFIYSILISDGKLDYRDFKIASVIFTGIEETMDFVEARLKQEEKVDRYSEYEAIPFKGIGFLEKVVRRVEDYTFAIDKTLEWSEKYGGITSFSVSNIFEQIVLLKNSSGKLYLVAVKNKFYDKNNFSKILKCLFRLPLNKVNLSIFNEVIQKSIELGCEEEMGKLLKSKIYPEDTWCSTLGEVPTAFIEKENVFQELKNNVPAGMLKNILDECTQGVKSLIESHKKEDENLFHAR